MLMLKLLYELPGKEGGAGVNQGKMRHMYNFRKQINDQVEKHKIKCYIDGRRGFSDSFDGKRKDLVSP